MQSLMTAAVNHTAVEESSSGALMVVLVIRTLLAARTHSDAPFAASLERKTESLMVADRGPEVLTAPPLPEAT